MKKILIANFIIFNIGFAALSYEDLNKEHWAYSSVENLVKKGIIKENSYKFNGEEAITRYEFAYDLSNMLDKLDLQKANKEDLNILEALILEFSKELNKMGFDTGTYNSKIDNINETVELLKKRINENEITIDQLKLRIEKLENRK